MSLLLVLACTNAAPHVASPLTNVPETERFGLPLHRPGWVVTTEFGVPHIYAQDRHDLAVIMGFTIGRDRFFQIDLARRLALGELSALLGDVALEADLESRGIGMTWATDRILATAPPALLELFDGYAEGLNAYIDAVEAGTVPAPSEYQLAYALLGHESPAAAMGRFERRDVAAIGGAVLYRLGYESDDVGRAADFDLITAGFADLPFADLRHEAALGAYATLHPIHEVVSAPEGWTTARQGVARPAPLPGPRVETSQLQRLRTRLDAWQRAMGRDHVDGWGSNAWAVDAAHSATGHALLAGDGHLELDIPALMYQVGLDDEHLGGGSTHQVGMSIVGIPMLAVGTNGDVAWSTTQLSGDVTDWYAEVVQLDGAGAPFSTTFQGADLPLVAVDEVVEVAGTTLGAGPARTLTVTRWMTPDGRWLASVEGTPALADTVPPAGSTLVNLSGGWVIPGDVDGDGIVTGVSFDFGGLDDGNLLDMVDRMGRATDVHELAQINHMAQAYSQNLVAADRFGDILYSGYQITPCREDLRDASGAWKPGGDPQRLLDGTTFGGFTLPVGADNAVVENDPQDCVVPWEQTPHSLSPSQGFVLTANNDPGGLSFDDDLTNGPIYMGGPWDDGFRAHTIEQGLIAATTRGATVADMETLQADHHSPTAELLLPLALASLDRTAALDGAAVGPDAIVRELYAARASEIDEVRSRLAAWLERGALARSGVATFYDPRLDQDEDDAVATMIWNTWLGDLNTRILEDEGLPGAAFRLGGTAGHLRVLYEMLAAAEGDNPFGLAGLMPDTQTPVWFDDATTEAVEGPDEVVLLALIDSLDFLAGPSTGPGEGGFATTEMDAWLWGLRHQVEFRSLVLGYFDDPLLGALFDAFAIDTSDLPLAADLPIDDPRAELTWFPRHGDNRNVDAGNPGLSGRSFRYGAGPVMRMVFELDPDGVIGQNIAPGGQSGVLGSPHYADQAARWLANDVGPVSFSVDEVAAAGLARTTLVPFDGSEL